MARQHRQEFVFGSGSFLDVLCNMVGILIILIAVVGMRVADKDDPAIDFSPDDSPQIVQPDPDLEFRRQQVAAREREIAEQVAAHQQALVVHQQEARRKQAEWERMLRDMQSRIQQLSTQEKEQQQHLQAETVALNEETKKRTHLASLIASAAHQNADLRTNEKELQQQALELMQRRKDIQAEIEAKKVARAIRRPVFQIVARDGNSGTNRRPILIECRADGLEFVSEKINLTPNDLGEFAPDYNPLLAGAEALLTYWNIVDAREGESKLKPYVLLIVRPGGTVGFYVARKYLESLNEDYGYELVPEGTEIQWPPADPQAQEVCRRAVDDVMNGPRGSAAQRFVNGRGGTGEQGRNSGNGIGTGPGSRFKSGTKPIVGQDGNFQLPEVEQLRRSSPRDSIDMLGPKWSPQRQKLAGTRAGTARDPNGALVPPSPDATEPFPPNGEFSSGDETRPEGRMAEENRYFHTGKGNGEEEQSTADRNRQSANAENAAVGGTARSGFNLQPAGPSPRTNGNSRLMPSDPELARPSGGSRGSVGAKPSGMPDNPLEERESGIRNDGGTDRQWGHGRSSSSIGIERDIVMHLYAERILIVKGPSVDLPAGIGREEFHEIIAAMIQAEANSWGEPPAKFTWRPRLKIQIHPGGNQHYARLKDLIQHWGLSSTVEQMLD